MSPEQYQSISNVYRLLARLWLTEVDTELLRAISATNTAEALQVAPEMADDLQVIEQLAVDFCSLWIGPKEHLPPYQSVWEEGQLQSETTDSVTSFAAAVHFKSSGETMADHLGFQLQLMGHVTELLSRGDADAELVELSGEFFKRHLAWADRLLSAAGRKAETDFYRSMVRLTKELLVSEREYWLSR